MGHWLEFQLQLGYCKVLMGCLGPDQDYQDGTKPGHAAARCAVLASAAQASRNCRTLSGCW